MMIKNLSRAIALAGALVLPVALAAPAAAEYPERTIRIVAPFGPGGTSDLTARLLAGPLSEVLGQPVIVENRPGAGSNLGTGEVARAEPDGYTLLITSSAFLVNPSLYQNAPFDPVADFAPIMTVSATPNVILAHPESGISSLDDLLAQARANPGVLNYASPGAGTTGHLAGALFNMMGGLEIEHIPFGGGGPAMQAILAGTTKMGIAAVPSAMRHIKSGAAIPIAVTSPEPWPDLPDVPTVASRPGFEGYEFNNIVAFVAPAGTPPEVIDRLYTETKAVMAREDVHKAIRNAGFMPVDSNPEAMAAQIKREVAAYKTLIEEAGIELR